MVKKLFSFLPVHKAKLMKKRVDQKRLLLKRVLDFLKSDNYMFAPLVSSQNSTFTTSSAGFEAFEQPMKTKQKKLSGKVKDYMTSDCYLYAPLVSNEPPGLLSFGETSSDIISPRESSKTVPEENKGLGQITESNSVTEQHFHGYPYTRSAVIRHTLMQKETVKHVIQQNNRPSPVEGDEKKKKSGRKGAKVKGSSTANTKKSV
ncbi:OLC1v1035326C1 [Oldenlandia corymbosa var. corymbosa]|uniref:OLC1v1035326C1 n=1 Tax=Oldenlandia corymbosa var. corymbosa TaxID=529605 RepID=A0AAV1CTF6_OLDCO|nr:OLC1v1035326C1 [Oldenlandia corymbosa var. corymbosa]